MQDLVAEPSDTVPANVTPERVVAGSAIFNGRSCVFCHAVGGRGVGSSAPNLPDTEWLHSAGDFPGIRRTIFWGVEKNEMKAITPRRPEMFPRGGLPIDDQAVAALTAYIWTLSRPQTNSFVAAQAQFIDLVRGRRVPEAIALFRRELRSAPDGLLPESGVLRLARSLAADQQQDRTRLLQFAAELYPKSAAAHSALGDAFAAGGQRANAVQSYRRALALEPDDEDTRKKLEAIEK